MSLASHVLEAYQILVSTLITEKTTFQKAALNQITFVVPVAANKVLIRRAVEEAFGVRVISVATQLHKGRATRFKGHRGYQSSLKKAIVSIDRQQMITI